MSTDQIEKTILLQAPLDRVWDAIADSSKFGTWFGAKFDGPFEAGRCIRATIVPTTMDAEVGASQQKYAGVPFAVQVETVDAPRCLAFRWNPSAEASPDLDAGPTTLVTFELEATDGGTQLRITESGFDSIPLAQRAAVFASNDKGWDEQCRCIVAFLAQQA